MKLKSLAASVFCVVLMALPAAAETVMMHATLSASNESALKVPSNGSGSVAVTYSTLSQIITWSGTYTGLSSPATFAHIKLGASGENGTVAVPIFGKGNSSPFEGAARLTDAQASALMAGGLYIEIQTEKNVAGEIRGQITSGGTVQ